jgi:hypothetical protein
MHPAPAVFLPGRVAQHPLSAPAVSLFQNESASLRIEQVRRISLLRHFLTMEQDGFYSEMREIEKSVYIAADAELLRYDADNSLDYGRAWGGASAGDIVGAANVCVSSGRVMQFSRSSHRSGMQQSANGAHMSSWALVQGQAQQGQTVTRPAILC